MRETAEIDRITRTLRSGVSTALVVFAALTLSVNAHAQSSVQQLRLIGYYSLLRGSQMVGVGSREPTFAVALGGEVAWTGFVSKHIGIDGSIDIGESTTTDNAYYARLESAIFTPISIAKASAATRSFSARAPASLVAIAFGGQRCARIRTRLRALRILRRGSRRSTRRGRARRSTRVSRLVRT